jgi:hypothetical protein
LPGAGVGLHKLNGSLYPAAVVVVVNPDHAEASFEAKKENSDHISAVELRLEASQQGSAEADVAGANFLQKSLAFGFDAPDEKSKINLPSWFAAPVEVVGVSHTIDWLTGNFYAAHFLQLRVRAL